MPTKRRSSRPSKSKPSTASDPSSPNAPKSPTSPIKTHRKRKALESLDTHPPSPGTHRIWSSTDVLNLMKTILQFRAQTGANPTASTLSPFYQTAKPSLPAHITQDQVYNKICYLRRKYLLAAPHDTPFYNLAAEVWGASRPETGEEDGDEGDDLFFVVRRNLVEYCRENGLSGDLLEAGLKVIDPEKARVLEGNWGNLYDTYMKIEAKRCDLDKELLMMLGAVYRTTSS